MDPIMESKSNRSAIFVARSRSMRSGHLVAVATALALLIAAGAAGQAQAPAAPQSPPTLPSASQATQAAPVAHITLDRAVELALQHNHSLLAERTTIDQNRAQETTANF